jgi:molybdopterin molybdotransferase
MSTEQRQVGHPASEPKGFFKLKELSAARGLCEEAFDGLRTSVETVRCDDALERVLATDVRSPGPVPHFARSVVDGYALRSADVAGSTAGQPAYLELVGEVVMGRPAELTLGPGEAAVVPTGGMIPRGADAAVMVEHTERLGETTLEVSRAVPPGAHVIGVGEDVQADAICLEAGRRLGPGELALLATIGVTEVEVHKRPRVALLSTGDEVVAPELTPGPAEVRDANAAGLAAMVRMAGGEPRFDGIVKDVFGSLEASARRSLEEADVLLISGGSSVGERDHAAAVLESLGEPGVLFHGVAIKPGKPTIVARADSKVVFGLPGHPLSAMVSFFTLVRPVLRRLTGQEDLSEVTTKARLTRKVPSDSGRTEFVRARLSVDASGEVWAEPLFGKSAALSSLVAARGLVEVPLGVEGLDQGATVTVMYL